MSLGSAPAKGTTPTESSGRENIEVAVQMLRSVLQICHRVGEYAEYEGRGRGEKEGRYHLKTTAHAHPVHSSNDRLLTGAPGEPAEAARGMP